MVIQQPTWRAGAGSCKRGSTSLLKMWSHCAFTHFFFTKLKTSWENIFVKVQHIGTLLKTKTNKKLAKLQLLEKPRHVTLITILRYNPFFTLLNTYVYLQMWEELFTLKILMMVTTICLFLVEGAAVWRKSKIIFSKVPYIQVYFVMTKWVL